jgi:phospholipid/cholesterol/gamma-HCH transport system substrate-binding protein
MSLQPGSEDDMLQSGDQIQFTQSSPGFEELLGQVIFNLNKDKDGDKGGSKKRGSAMPSAAHP